VNEAMTSGIMELLNEGEYARYAPGNADATMDRIYSNAIEIISKMENSIKR
jgi:hypothetical protein